jgi:hypothetical protein
MPPLCITVAAQATDRADLADSSHPEAVAGWYAARPPPSGALMRRADRIGPAIAICDVRYRAGVSSSSWSL